MKLTMCAMNDFAAPASPVDAYLARLPIPDEERARLRQASGGSMAGLHGALAGGAGAAAGAGNPAYDSVPARLKLTFAGPRKRGDARAASVFEPDLRGQTRLAAATPPLRRASMAPRPWSTNPLLRLLRRLLGRGAGQPEPGAEARPAAPRWRWVALWRRTVLFGLAIAQTIVATYYMTAVLPYHGSNPLEIAILVLYAILFGWVSMGFWTAIMGFFVLLLGGDSHAISRTAPADAPIDAAARTALLMPICNEDVPRVLAGLRATYDSVAKAGLLAHFDFYILSDSGDPDTRVAEVDAWLKLCREVDGFGRIFYRRRTHRIKRKSGNIADFCRRWGNNYRYMVILDADSVMSGSCLKRLVQLMEANPDAGIIQTAPKASGRETLYARMQQFATSVYGPLFTAGLHFWQLGESHYWGHNAIIRVAPFIKHCALGRLPGRGVLSGEILSHDFVEAALMRRAGWLVWIAYDLSGSYEEMPPNLLDELKRDRRWCQGNLMNFRLFLAQGLHPAHRAVFMTGVMAYLSAPLWFLSLLLSTALLAVQTLSVPKYFTSPHQLFPLWPEWHPEWAIALFSATATLLFLPKILSVVLIWAKGAKNFGGAAHLFASMFTELVFSALLAPIRMLFHTQFVLTALAGLGVSWKSPPRADSETTWGEALQRHGLHSAIGVLWAGGVYWLNPSFLWWLLPVVGALIVSIPLSVYSSRVSLGRRMRRWRYFLIPEEANPPRELRWTMAAVRRTPEPPGFAEAVTDPVVNALACAAAVARQRPSPITLERREQILAEALSKGLESLSAVQKNTLLGDPIYLSRLHFLVWSGVSQAPPAQVTIP
ncbi:MAG: glucans biosynthesis glucosyltransferase MdoH [Nevskia sp.]|nr:glucans biosynthesis glucosyltransferase MdoH [Nevskia sp.]